MPTDTDPTSGSRTAAVLEAAYPHFRPKFRNFDDEGWDFGAFAHKWAQKNLDAAEIDGIGLSGLTALARKDRWLDRYAAAYYAAGRHDLVEAAYTVSEWAAELPWREMQARIRELAEVGHGVRAMRCWRHYVRKLAGFLWQEIRDRDAALRHEARNPGAPPRPYTFPAATYAEAAARNKKTLLEAIKLAEPFFAAYGSDRDRAWLERTRTEAVAEERAVLADRPDPAPMTEELFWQIIEAGGETAEERLETLVERVAAYSPKAIKAFGQMALDRTAQVYRADIWALAYLLMDGCSDDAFEMFRNWLVLQGRAVFEATLADPDAFEVERAAGGPLVEGLGEFVEQAHELRSGKAMPRLKQPRLKTRGKLDEAAFPAMLPRVAARTA